MASLNLYQTIRNIILQSVDTTIFLPNNITRTFQGVQGENFIVFRLFNAAKTGIKGQKILRKTTTGNSRTFINLMRNLVQIDIYTTSRDSTTAYDSAATIYQFLTEQANDYLIEAYGNTDLSIGEIDEIIDNTALLDKSVYTARYTIRFDLFNHLVNTTNNLPEQTVDIKVIGVN